MYQLYVPYLIQIFGQFNSTEASLLSAGDPRAYLSDSYLREYSRVWAFDLIEQGREVFSDDNLMARAWRLKTQLAGGERFTGEALARELNGLSGQMVQALNKRKFAFIPTPNDQYFEQDKLFGDDVFNVFKNARIDIKDAGNSFAASLYTACVIHLMRASEHGMRRLAKKLRVTIKHTNSLIPLEYGEWDAIVKEINKKISDARALSRGPKRQRICEVYSDAGQHCLFMKDIRRNTAAHARKAYTHNEALAAMERVRDFLQFLAKGL